MKNLILLIAATVILVSCSTTTEQVSTPVACDSTTTICADSTICDSVIVK